MATNGMPMDGQQDQSAAPQGGGAPADDSQQAPQTPAAQSQPSQSPANQMQVLLAKWYRAAKEMAQADPRLASGAQKVADGIQEMQQALVVPAQKTPTYQQPSY